MHCCAAWCRCVATLPTPHPHPDAPSPLCAALLPARATGCYAHSLIFCGAQNERKGASMPDRLAPMVSVPEALIHCRPPTLAQAMPGGSELDVGVDVPPPLDAKLSMQIEEWSFNLHAVPDAELPALAYGAMIKHPEFSEMDLNKKRLWRCVAPRLPAEHPPPPPFRSFVCGLACARGSLHARFVPQVYQGDFKQVSGQPVPLISARRRRDPCLELSRAHGAAAQP